MRWKNQPLSGRCAIKGRAQPTRKRRKPQPLVSADANNLLDRSYRELDHLNLDFCFKVLISDHISDILSSVGLTFFQGPPPLTKGD